MTGHSRPNYPQTVHSGGENSMRKIGFLNSGSASKFSELFDVFQQNLKDSGFEHGKNVQIVPKWANGDYDKLEPFAVDLVDEPVDVIAATGGLISALAAVRATRRIPIVFAGGYSPARVAFRRGIKGPPANATGFSLSTTETVKDRRDELHKFLKKKFKTAMLLHLYNNPTPTYVYDHELKQAANASLEVVDDSAGLDQAFQDAVSKGARALLVCADPYFTTQRAKIIALAKQYSLPTAYPFRHYADDGGLLSFGPSLRKTYRGVGDYVANILKGTPISNLPVKAAKISEFETVINGTTAVELGLKIPKMMRKHAQII